MVLSQKNATQLWGFGEKGLFFPPSIHAFLASTEAVDWGNMPRGNLRAYG